MAREDNLYELPEGLPIPVEDGASAHLPGMRLPSVPLRSTRAPALFTESPRLIHRASRKKPAHLRLINHQTSTQTTEIAVSTTISLCGTGEYCL